MPINRLFFEGALNPDTQIRLEGDEAHHLTRVLRARPGDALELTNGHHLLAQCHILSTDPHVDIFIDKVIRVQPPLPPLILLQALPKPTKLDFIVEKATELGATQIRLFPSSRSESTQPKNLIRLQTLIRSAIKQSGRLDTPELLLDPPLLKWTSLPCTTFYGDLRDEAPLLHTIYKKSLEPIAFLTGPESGLAPNELELLSRLGATGVRLHPYTLRTETASLAALSILSHLLA